MSALIDRNRRAYEADPAAQARWVSGEAFVRAGPYSVKVKCATCHRTGYGSTGRRDVQPYPWQYPCLLGHAPCDQGCGRMFVLRFDGTPKTHAHHRHACPGPQEAHP